MKIVISYAQTQVDLVADYIFLHNSFLKLSSTEIKERILKTIYRMASKNVAILEREIQSQQITTDWHHFESTAGFTVMMHLDEQTKELTRLSVDVLVDLSVSQERVYIQDIVDSSLLRH